MKFYTSIHQERGQMFVLGYENGVRVKNKVDYKPYLFIPSQQETEYHNIYGSPVGRVDFNSIGEAREFQKKYENVENFAVYGMNKFIYPYIYDEYINGKDVDYDLNVISNVFIDIETSLVGPNGESLGFPDVAAADNPITLITIGKNNQYWTFGTYPFNNNDPEVTYVLCNSEREVLENFIKTWELLDPDCVSGWNTEFFDVPYLINRITNVLGNSWAERMSPWSKIIHNTVEIMGKEQQASYPLGVNNMDYMQLYKKFSQDKQESYSLNHIAQEELGEKKLEYDGTLAELEVNDWQTYVEYNIHDVKLVVRLDAKLKFIDLAATIAYIAGATYQDAMATVSIWDALIHRYLMQRNVVVNPFVHTSPTRDIVGGYVKDPQLGMHDWNASFDLRALYPSLIMAFNISPETYAGKYHEQFTVDEFVNGFMNETRTKYLVDNNLTLAANGCMFRRDKEGFLPAIMRMIFDTRAVVKDQQIEYEKQNVSIEAELRRRNIKF